MGGGGGVPADDAGPVEDVVVVDVSVSDGRPVPDAAPRDVCVPTGQEQCDGLDNNCEGRIDENACRDGCIGAAFEGVGYMLCYRDDRTRNWRDAEMDCVAHNMHLARVDSEAQNAFIRATGMNVNFDGNIWIGGSDADVEGRWVWIDGTQFWMGNFSGQPVDGHFTAWSMGQPNSASGQEDCLAMWMGVSTWHDATCGTREAYMCQALARSF
jgi:hypothetical protein